MSKLDEGVVDVEEDVLDCSLMLISTNLLFCSWRVRRAFCSCEFCWRTLFSFSESLSSLFWRSSIVD